MVLEYLTGEEWTALCHLENASISPKQKRELRAAAGRFYADLHAVTRLAAGEESVSSAAFYSRLLGWEIGSRGVPDGESGDAGWVNMRNPPGTMGPRFQAEGWYEPPVWPEEPGAQAKMMHLEICVDDVEASVALAIEAGGRIAPYRPDDHAMDELRVVLGPAGHPFCLFVEGQ